MGAKNCIGVPNVRNKEGVAALVGADRVALHEGDSLTPLNLEQTTQARPITDADSTRI